jgi:hypothetical protein
MLATVSKSVTKTESPLLPKLKLRAPVRSMTIEEKAELDLMELKAHPRTNSELMHYSLSEAWGGRENVPDTCKDLFVAAADLYIVVRTNGRWPKWKNAPASTQHRPFNMVVYADGDIVSRHIRAQGSWDK